MLKELICPLASEIYQDIQIYVRMCLIPEK